MRYLKCQIYRKLSLNKCSFACPYPCLNFSWISNNYFPKHPTGGAQTQHCQGGGWYFNPTLTIVSGFNFGNFENISLFLFRTLLRPHPKRGEPIKMFYNWGLCHLASFSSELVSYSRIRNHSSQRDCHIRARATAGAHPCCASHSTAQSCPCTQKASHIKPGPTINGYTKHSWRFMVNCAAGGCGQVI